MQLIHFAAICPVSKVGNGVPRYYDQNINSFKLLEANEAGIVM
jgi:hypothetical protein